MFFFILPKVQKLVKQKRRCKNEKVNINSALCSNAFVCFFICFVVLSFGCCYSGQLNCTMMAKKTQCKIFSRKTEKSFKDAIYKLTVVEDHTQQMIRLDH